MSKNMKSDGNLMRWVMVSLSLIMAGVITQPAAARVAAPDQAFLDREVAAAQALAAEADAGLGGPEPALELVRRMLGRKATASAELAASMSLTDLDGIETMDRYDHALVLALDDVARAGLAADPVPPPETHAQRFSEVMGTPPDLGDKPVAFMILGLAEILVTTVDLMHNDPSAPAPSPAKLALQRLEEASSKYRAVQEDFLIASKAEAFRQSSVVLRMRCQKDGAAFKVNTMKNKVGSEGQISTLYFLECPVCHIPDVVEFPLEIATRLNQASERQRLKTPPRPRQPEGGLRP